MAVCEMRGIDMCACMHEHVENESMRSDTLRVRRHIHSDQYLK